MAATGPETSSESDGSAGPVDETRHRRLTTRLGRDRFARGQRAIIDVAARWDGTTLLGALSEGETRVHRRERSVTPEATIRFLRSLAEAFGEELIAVRENVSYFTSQKVGQSSPSVRPFDAIEHPSQSTPECCNCRTSQWCSITYIRPCWCSMFE
jgi:hypothetical protein